MAEVYIAASPGEAARARGLAEAFTALGLDTASGFPAETEIPGIVDAAKCVTTLWTGEEPPAGLAVLAALALERKKLVNAEISADAAPALFRAAPRVALNPRDRNAFKTRFRDLVAEIDKLAEKKSTADALPAALVTARAALLQKTPEKNKQWRTLAVFVSAVAVLFVVGFGAGRVINAVRAGEFEIAWPKQRSAEPTAVAATPTAPQTPPQNTLADLDTAPWRESAVRLGDATPIKAAAAAGDARAQALACLGHLAGVEGFLPSPTAARGFCDQSAAQNDPAGLYFSWVLRRTAPHAGISETTARERLAQAARLGWMSAIIDYGQVLAANTGAPIASQAEAGRLFLAAAERGDARGQFFYARWLRDSPAGPRDPTAALPFLNQAAEQNQPDALHMLATLYRDGIGVPVDTTRAKALYDRAARQNHPPSMFNLADLLKDGNEADRARAVELFGQLACMRDERQIQPMAARRLAALRGSARCS
jgi:TPR repeat protein